MMLQRSTTSAVSTGFSHVIIDVETRSSLNLTEVGAPRYAAHPSTQVLVVAFAIDDADPEVWFPTADLTPPPQLVAAFADQAVPPVAHNAGFEIEVCRHQLTHFGLPEIPLERWYCTMTGALALALPPSLEKLAIALGLKFQKDKVGARLMRQMAKPEAADQDTPERLQALGLYCARDVLVTREIYLSLPALTEEEQALWALNERVNQRGVYFDRALVAAARNIAEQVRPELNAAISEATGGEITTTHQVRRLVRWLSAHGCPVDNVDKNTINELLASELPPEVRTVVELREAGSGSATAKFDNIIAGLENDNRARALFRSHGASTGRASSHRIQVQNLKHTALKDPEAAIAAILSGDLERVRAIDAPLKVLANLIRPSICAAPGNVLIGGDLSAIESRVLAAIGHEARKVDVNRKYDETGDPELEPYLVVARWVDPVKPNRAIGKCQSAPNFDPVSASNFDPFERRDLALALAPSELAGVAETA
jgi:DNA polymerase bacteriophage-type